MKKKKILDCVRFVVISPEVLVGLAVFALPLLWPEFLTFVSDFAQSKDAAIVVGILTVPVGLLIGAYKLGESLLAYGVDKGLAKWVDYWRLEYRVGFTAFVCVANMVSTLSALYFLHYGSHSLGASLLLGGWSIAGVSVITLGVARIKLRDVIAVEEK